MNNKSKMSDYVSSDAYRASSQEEEVHSAQLIRDYTPSAQQFANDHNVSLEEAFNHVLGNDGHNADEILWTRVPLNENDSTIGTVFKAKNITLVCNSALTDMYNDTYAVSFTDETNTSVTDKTNTFVTYRNLNSQDATHSGDIHTPYLNKGLRHKLKCYPRDVKRKMVIVSAPWKSSHRDLVSKLAETRPILEIRVDNDGKLERFIVPQDFSGGGQSTACASAMITWDGENWTVKILQEFINGFADDVETSISDLKKLELDKVPSVSHDEVSSVSHDELHSVSYDDEVPSVSYDYVVPSVSHNEFTIVSHDELHSVSYVDEVPSVPYDYVVPSVSHNEFTIVSHDNFSTSDYETEF